MIQEFMLWLAQGQNAAAVQAITAIVVAFLTLVLILITWWYARFSRKMAITMERQMVSAFNPVVGMTFGMRGHGESAGRGLETEYSIGSFVTVGNHCSLPVKVVAVKLELDFPKDKRFKTQTETIDGESLVLAPTENKEYLFSMTVAKEAQDAKYHRKFTVHCSDLAGVSRHSFRISDLEERVTHYLGFV